MSMSKGILGRIKPRTILAALAAGTFALALGYRQSQAKPRRIDDADTVRGKINRFTTAPMGETDGAVLDDGTWLNWPPHMQDRFTDIVKTGARVRASGRTETGPAGDTHFEIQSVTNLRTDDKAENPDFADGPPPPPGGAPGRAAARQLPPRGLEDGDARPRRGTGGLRRDAPRHEV